jgi:NifU-like protein involved in Fe-S cluster formation
MNEDLILELYKNSPHRDVDSSVPAREPGVSRNVQCGDEVFLKWELADGTITKAKFSASACSITIASAEFLCQQIEGKKLAEISTSTLKDEMLSSFGMTETGPRAFCALLPYEALEDLLESTMAN